MWGGGGGGGGGVLRNPSARLPAPQSVLSPTHPPARPPTYQIPPPQHPVQAFASPERVAEVLARVRQALDTSLPTAAGAMRLYLPSPATHAILFKPIKSNVAEAHGQIAALLEREYTPEEGVAMGLTPPDQLSALLESLS